MNSKLPQMVKKTGLTKVTKGELVIPTKQVKKVQSLLKKAGMPCGCGCKGATRK